MTQLHVMSFSRLVLEYLAVKLLFQQDYGWYGSYGWFWDESYDSPMYIRQLLRSGVMPYHTIHTPSEREKVLMLNILKMDSEKHALSRVSSSVNTVLEVEWVFQTCDVSIIKNTVL